MKKAGALAALLALAGLGAAVAFSGDASAKPKPSADVTRRMADALATQEPAAIRLEAAKLRLEGHHVQASELEVAAAELEADLLSVGLPIVEPPEVVASPGWPQPTAGAPVGPPQIVDTSGAPVPDWLLQVPGQLDQLFKSGQVVARAPAPTKQQGLPTRAAPAPAIPTPTTVTAKKRDFRTELLKVGDPTPGAPLLKRGSKGTAVVAWQKDLLAFNPSILPRFGADGDFGAETDAATKQLQVAANALYLSVDVPTIKVDGIVGPQTRTASARLRRAPTLAVA